MEKNIEVGDICRCRHGHVGIVREIVHNGFSKLYKGLHLTNNGGLGKSWQSSDPTLVLSQTNLENLDKG
jgi:hypothetical protein